MWGDRVKLPEASALRRLAQRLVQVPRAPRQDRLAAALAGLVWLLLMLGVVATSHGSLEARRAEHHEARAVLARAASLSQQEPHIGPPVSETDAPALIAVVNRSAPAFALAFGDFRPEGEARLALGLRGGDFDALLRWLVQLEKQHGIAVAAMDVRPTGTPGRVDAGLTLTRHPSARREDQSPPR